MDPATIAALAGLGDAGGSFVGGLLGWGGRDDALDGLLGTNEQANPLASEDPELKKRQMAALEQMYRMASEGGMDPQSKAALAKIEGLRHKDFDLSSVATGEERLEKNGEVKKYPRTWPKVRSKSRSARGMTKPKIPCAAWLANDVWVRDIAPTRHGLP
jgi:hypothetical protein